MKTRMQGRNLIAIIALLLFFPILWVDYYLLERNRIEAERLTQDLLESTRDTTADGLKIWIDAKIQHIESVANNAEVINLAQELLALSDEGEELTNSPALGQLRQFVSTLSPSSVSLEENAGLFLINKDYISVASMRDDNIGKVNLIYQNYPDILERAFNGEAIFIPPIISDVALFNDRGDLIRTSPTLFFAAPLKNDENEVIAVLTLRDDPRSSLTQLAQTGRFGETGETYFFDSQARMVSSSRFENELHQIGLLGDEENSIFNIEIRDPGVNLTEAENINFQDLPLTTMAQAAIDREAGFNSQGYRDYRGIEVLGAWSWIDEANIGIASEIDANEIFGPLTLYNSALITIQGTTLLAVLVLMIIISRNNKRHIGRLEDSLVGTIHTTALTVEKRDPYTSGHMSRVAELSVAIAKKLGFSESRIEGLSLGASIHDLGKIYVPVEILNRPGKLSEAEFEIIKSHPKVGYDIIKEIDFPWPIGDMILSHHEKLDGSGYPNALKGDEISIEAQILAVADVLEAISSHRPYRPALGISKGLQIIKEGKGKFFNPEIVDICATLIEKDGFKFSTTF